ncbi:pancreatic lipase-related protein 2-like, partial [Spea bombifrons]|uniref:pancreatic lipase-related protein 2-like n=1 Tax=Spea bombifrons TaxID=233779 RepID=UPI002349C541
LLLYTARGAGEVCYDRLGCFPDGPPWSGTAERPIAAEPSPPDVIDTRFLLYTQKNRDSYQIISAKEPSSITNSNFSTSRKTRFIIHGFFQSGEMALIVEICRRLLQVEDVNCISVDWSGGSITLYSQAANNIRVVGAEVAYFLDVLSEKFGYSPSNVHLIGHSMGAHAVGEAGRRKKGIKRASGLDPAQPYFQNTPAEVHLDLSDADLVDIIHTNGAPFIPNLGLGMSQVIGHLDFFPNGGEQMPECPLNAGLPVPSDLTIEQIFADAASPLLCNHQSSVRYYTESITNPDLYTSYPCADYPTFQSGGCRTCPSAGCPKMGHYADTYSGVTSSSQVFYLNTP